MIAPRCTDRGEIVSASRSTANRAGRRSGAVAITARVGHWPAWPYGAHAHTFVSTGGT
jgi:hypothetical protein